MFKDRVDAGLQLAKQLKQELNESEINSFAVLSIPRGGVVLGQQIADTFNCPQDIIVTKKIPAPNQTELAVGAIGQTKGSLYLNERIVAELEISKSHIEKETLNCQKEIGRREKLYRSNKQEIKLQEKVVIIVDDGAATGATIISAAREVWNRNPKKVIIALPVCSLATLAKLEKEADMVVVLETPENFYAVGQFYEDFPQISDDEVINLLTRLIAK
jgi:putative phosphoribosyl transferase